MSSLSRLLPNPTVSCGPRRRLYLTAMENSSVLNLGLEQLTHLPRSAIIVKIRLQEMARTRVNKLLEKLR
jgi:hypothetical protein